MYPQNRRIRHRAPRLTHVFSVYKSHRMAYVYKYALVCEMCKQTYFLLLPLSASFMPKDTNHTNIKSSVWYSILAHCIDFICSPFGMQNFRFFNLIGTFSYETPQKFLDFLKKILQRSPCIFQQSRVGNLIHAIKIVQKKNYNANWE